MKMTSSIKLPRSLWSDQDSETLGLNAIAAIKSRTSKGLDGDLEPFAMYSEKPITISKKGARLSPKGGRPSESGDSVFYEQGYRQYKHESRGRSDRAASAEVDLVLSGALMNNIILTQADRTGFTISLSDHVAYYGYRVNADREFLKLDEDTIKVLTQAVNIDIANRLKGGRR